MAAFRFFLAIVLVCLSTYTEVVGLNHGWNLLPIFFSNIADSLRPVAWATWSLHVNSSKNWAFSV